MAGPTYTSIQNSAVLGRRGPALLSILTPYPNGCDFFSGQDTLGWDNTPEPVQPFAQRPLPISLLGPAFQIVPSVLGLTQSVAQSTLVSQGFGYAIGSPVSSSYPVGTVAIQSIPGGTSEPLGTVVTIQLSSGVAITGSAAIAEPPDIASGVGAASLQGAAAITEPSDTVAGTGDTSTHGAAAITEPPDTVAAAGTVSVSGIANVFESADHVVAAGQPIASGSGAPAETPDTAAGTGTARYVGTAAIVEPADSATGSGSVSYTATGQAVERPDTVAGAGSIQVYGSGTAPESPDIVAGVGITGARFGNSTITVNACVILEGTASFVTVDFVDETGKPFIPNSASYRLDDVASGTQILGWTALANLELTMLITVTAAQNALIGRPTETHQCIVQLVDGYGNTDNIKVTWEVCQAVGLPN